MAKRKEKLPIQDITLDKSVRMDVFLQVKISMFSSGLVAQIGTNNAITLMAIASYINKDDECWPTQRQLAERLGKGKNFVNDRIAELESFRVDGKPLLTRRIERRGGYGGYESTIYKIHPQALVGFGKGDYKENPQKN